MNVALCPGDRTDGDALTVISLCTGGGALDLGLELACPSARTVLMVEREAFAVATLVAAIEAGHLAPAAVWSDVTTLNARPWRGLVDGVIGGIPCQPHSLAGKRRGEDDERDLWSDARRVIVQSGCWFVLIENVGGMLSSGGAERVRRDLHRLGFHVEGGLFTASEVGASHERQRLFIFAVADTERSSCRQRREPDLLRGWSGNAEQVGVGSSGCDADLVDACGLLMADADRERLQRLRPDDAALGRQDARRPAGLCGGTAMVDTARVGRGEGRPKPGVRRGRNPLAKDGIAVDDAPIARSGAISVQPGRSLEAGGDADGAGTSGVEGQRHDRERERPLFPPGPGERGRWADILARFPETEPALRGVADGLAAGLDASRVDRLRMLGNGVVPLEAAYAWRTLVMRAARSGSAGATELVRRLIA